MRTLTELLTSAAPATDKQTAHSYGPLYDCWLGPLQDRACRLLELGVSMFGGGDLLAFAEFLALAEIVGIDATREGLLPEVLAHPRIRIVLLDVYAGPPDVVLDESMAKPFDAIIDDCDHHPDRQLQAFDYYWPLVAPGGQYVIEDVHSQAVPGLLMALNQRKPGRIEVHDLRGQRPQSTENILFRILKGAG